MISYKEYAKQMRKNNIAVNGILQVDEELWLQIADIIDELAEKQIPKKPEIKITGSTGWNTTTYCPACKKEILGGNYCLHCGQALDWGQGE